MIRIKNCGRKSDIGGLTNDLALHVAMRADTVQRLAGGGGFGRGPFVMKVALQPRAAGAWRNARRRV